MPEAFGLPRIGSDDDFGEVVDGLHNGTSHAQGADFSEAVDAGVGVDADEEVDASVVVAEGEGLDFGDFQLVEVCVLCRRSIGGVHGRVTDLPIPRDCALVGFTSS